MEFIDVLKTRRSTRKFLSKNVPQAKLNEIIELANLAPSAGNLQARAVVIVRDQKIIEKIKSITFGLIYFKTIIPVLLVILAKPKESSAKYKERGKNYALQDATIFAAYIQLIAAEKGLSTGWVGTLDEEKIREILDLPREVKPIAIIPLGYASEEPLPKDRKSLNEIILKEV